MKKYILIISFFLNTFPFTERGIFKPATLITIPIAVLSQRKSFYLQDNFSILMLLLFSYSFLSLIIISVQNDFQLRSLFECILIGLSLAAYNFGYTNHDQILSKRSINSLTNVVLFLLLLGIFQSLMNNNDSINIFRSVLANNNFLNSGRVPLLTVEPSYAAIEIIPISLGLFFVHIAQTRHTIRALILISLILILVLLFKSSSAYIIFLISIILIIVCLFFSNPEHINKKVKFHLYFLSFVLFFGTVAIIGFHGDQYADRVTNLVSSQFDESIMTRFVSFEALNWYFDSDVFTIIFGIGPDQAGKYSREMFGHVYGEYLLEDWFYGEKYADIKIYYINVVISYGIFGVLFNSFLILKLIQIFRHIFKTPYLFLLIPLFGFCVGGFSINLFGFSLFWVTLGISSRIVNDEKDTSLAAINFN